MPGLLRKPLLKRQLCQRKQIACLSIRCHHPSPRKVLIFSSESRNPRRPWQCACYEFWEKPQYLEYSVPRMPLGAARARVYFYSDNRPTGPELLKAGGSRNEGELYSTRAPRAANCGTAAPGLRQCGDSPAAQNGQTHGEGAL
jgi:hypothetical protein